MFKENTDIDYRIKFKIVKDHWQMGKAFILLVSHFSKLIKNSWFSGVVCILSQIKSCADITVLPIYNLFMKKFSQKKSYIISRWRIFCVFKINTLISWSYFTVDNWLSLELHFELIRSRTRNIGYSVCVAWSCNNKVLEQW